MMKKAKRGGGEDSGGSNSNSIEDRRTTISDLPEVILQRIICFLSQEEAVRTSILSKSWRYNWCTRPNLDFSEPTFKGNKQQFLSAVDKTLQRYRDEGPPMEEFKLCISLLGGEDRRAHRGSVSLLDKWIPIILTTTMGVALKEFRLSIVSGEWINSLSGDPCLVYELLLDDLLLVHNKIHFERLQVLGLQKVLIKQETFDRLISTCTLLTTVWLEDCEGLKSIKLDKELYKHLKHFAFTGGSVDIVQVHDVPTLETINISCRKIRFHGRHELSNLKSLTLKNSEFPIRICELRIDAPNILYFEYRGIVIPSISYAPNCRRSTLHLSLWCGYDVLSWFLKISELLQALRHSEISLDIFQHHMNIFSFQQDVLVRDIIINNGGNKPVVVEHLRWCIEYFATFPKLLNVFFTICRPRNIAQLRRGSLREERAKKEIRDYLCSLLMRREDLEELSIQRLDKCGQWRPVQGANLLESAQSQPLYFNRIRSQLKWRILDN